MTKSMLVSENLSAFTTSIDSEYIDIIVMYAIGTYSPDSSVYIQKMDCWLSTINDMRCLVKHYDGCTLVVTAPSEMPITQCFDALKRLSMAL